jgi:hypothetical protein
VTKHYEEREAHVEKRRVLARTTCDVCGEDVEDEKRHPENEWRAPWQDNTVKLEHRKQFGWGGDCRVEELEIDCCAKCFEEKILPALVALGLPRERAMYRDIDL